MKHLQFLNLSANKISSFSNVLHFKECEMLRILKLFKNPMEIAGLVKAICP